MKQIEMFLLFQLWRKLWPKSSHVIGTEELLNTKHMAEEKYSKVDLETVVMAFLKPRAQQHVGYKSDLSA